MLMKTALFAAIGAFGLVAMTFAGTAQAQCYWNGYGCGYYSYPTHPSVSVPYYGAQQPRWGTYGWDYMYHNPAVPYAGARPGPNH
jgi:hypothetical protein